MFYYLIIGLCIASFCNVLISRIPKQESFIMGHSKCVHCHHPLHILDLIPILSFISLLGTCRYCKQKISIQYPVIEAIGAVFSVLLFTMYGFHYEYIILYLIGMTLLVIAIIDYQTYYIYDSCLYALLFFVLCKVVYANQYNLVTHILGIFIISGFLCLMNQIIKHSFGVGDIKLYCILGYALGGISIVYSFILSIWLASLGSFIMMIIGKEKVKKIAFAPYICLSAMLFLLL